MIYFTKDALRVMKKKFFYLELMDKSKAVAYIQDKSKALEAVNKKNYKLKYSFYALLGKDMKENNVYLIGVANKELFQNNIFKILHKEKINIIYIPINSKWNILFLTDNERKKEKYMNCKMENSQWPCVIANESYISFLKTKIRPERELSNVIKELSEIKRK